jgi:hypothetical protein
MSSNRAVAHLKNDADYSASAGKENSDPNLPSPLDCYVSSSLLTKRNRTQQPIYYPKSDFVLPPQAPNSSHDSLVLEYWTEDHLFLSGEPSATKKSKKRRGRPTLSQPEETRHVPKMKSKKKRGRPALSQQNHDVSSDNIIAVPTDRGIRARARAEAAAIAAP